ncbi:MAG: hypothetical protein HGA70_01745 [Chlorobiaceae bacterium]|nr:hypothetical protein [Chlorobiaceae bacterium]NTW10217.1 hypothetical protein [Chlorobiaceae bacterium]
MNTRKKLPAVLICSALTLMSPKCCVFAAAGQSSSGSADISATVPDFIILHYYSSLDLNFATPTSEALNEGTSNLDVTWKGESSGSQLATGSLMSASLELDGATKTVTIPNVWAIRGFSKSGTASVAVTVPADKGVLSTSDGTSKIIMSNVRVSNNGNTAATINASLNGITRSKATIGSVLLDMNFDQTKKSGLHSGGQYLITASTQ